MPPPLPPMPPPPPEPPPPPPPDEDSSPRAAAAGSKISLKPGGKSGMTGFKMGSAKKMKTSLGSKPGIFGSATTDEPESNLAAPASATALPRKALSSGLPGPSESLSSMASVQAAGAGGLSAAQANAIAAAQATMQKANLGAPTPQMQAVQAAVQAAAAALTAGGLSGAGGAGAGSSSGAGAEAEEAGSADEAEDDAGGIDYTFNRKYTRSRVRQLPNCEGLRSIDVYENQGMVGKGAFNKVYKAKHRASGEIVALKSMQLETVGAGDGIPLEMIREMSTMAVEPYPYPQPEP